jgi:hypothetical protein
MSTLLSYLAKRYAWADKLEQLVSGSKSGEKNTASSLDEGQDSSESSPPAEVVLYSINNSY